MIELAEIGIRIDSQTDAASLILYHLIIPHGQRAQRIFHDDVLAAAESQAFQIHIVRATVGHENRAHLRLRENTGGRQSPEARSVSAAIAEPGHPARTCGTASDGAEDRKPE